MKDLNLMKRSWRNALIAGIVVLFPCLFFIPTVWLSSNSIFFNVSVIEKYICTHGHMAFSGPDNWIFLRPDLGAILMPWKHFNQNLKAISGLNDTLSKLGIKLYVVPVPDKASIIQSYSPFFVERVSNQRKRFLGKLRQQNVRVIDLNPVFIKHRHEDQLFIKGDTHWDQRGISLGAEFIASEIALPLILTSS